MLDQYATLIGTVVAKCGPGSILDYFYLSDDTSCRTSGACVRAPA